MMELRMESMISNIKKLVKKSSVKNRKFLKKLSKSIKSYTKPGNFLQTTNGSNNHCMSWEEVPVQNPAPWMHFTDFNDTLKSVDRSQSCQTANISDLISFGSRVENSYESLSTYHSPIQIPRKTVKIAEKVETFPDENEPRLVVTKLFDSVEEMKKDLSKSAPIIPLEPEVEVSPGNTSNDISMESETENQLYVNDFIQKFIHKKRVSKIMDNQVDVMNAKNLQTSPLTSENFTPIKTSTLCNTCDKHSASPPAHSPDKFVVNLYESRNSKKWNRKHVQTDGGNLENTISFICKPNVNNNNNNEDKFCGYIQSNKFNVYQMLRKERDVECIKLKEASNALRALRLQKKRHWADELVAERILLESSAKCKAVEEKIRDLSYSEVKSRTHFATISIGNFRFALTAPQMSDDFQHFYILLVSCGTDVKLSKTVAPTADGQILFDDIFKFEDIESNFTITVELHSIQFPVVHNNFFNSLKKKSNKFICPSTCSVIYYENLNTYEMAESSILRTSFKPIAEMDIRKQQAVMKDGWHLTNIPEWAQLQHNVTFYFNTDAVKINADLSGFLTMGRIVEDCMYWERKWCILNGAQLLVFNYPQDVAEMKPILTINLYFCLDSILNTECCRKSTFVLRACRPTSLGESATNDTKMLRVNTNFVVEKYFFNADTKDLFREWSDEIGYILQTLKDWNRLVFVDDTYSN